MSTMQKQQRLADIFLLLLLLGGSNSAVLSPQGSRLAENLGVLLGLPLNAEQPPADSSTVPDFLMATYDCWTSLGGSKNRTACMPVHDPAAKESLEGVNVVRGIEGTVLPSTNDGLFSHSPNTPFPASLTINFNSNLRRIKEDVRYVYIRVHKAPLTTDQRAFIKNQCPGNGPIPVQLLVKINTTSDSRGVYSLLSKAEVRRNEIGRQRQIEFSKITEQFKDWERDVHTGSIETRLIIGGDCYNRLSPQQIGFNTNSSSFIMIFAKSDDSEEAIIKAGFAELAAEATATRNKRKTNENVDNSEDTLSERLNSTDSTNSTNPSLAVFNTSTYHLRSCQRYSHTISFSELGWSDSIVRPPHFEANFCAGSCHFPLTGQYNTTKHSYIQSLAAKLNPHLVPPPCCAPHELRPVTVLYKQRNETFVVQEWPGMRAESCGCK